MSVRLAALVTAAGSSQRFNVNNSSNVKKEFVNLDGHSVLYHACLPFTQREDIVALFVTYRAGAKDETRAALEDLLEQKKIPIFLVEGGDTRQSSVFNALKELYRINDQLKVNCVCIHDGARPFVTEKIISDTVSAAMEVGGAVPVVRVTDTLIQTDKNGYMQKIVDREGVCRVQTPQTFVFPDIFNAHELAQGRPNIKYTDDTHIFIDFGKQVVAVEGSESNIKITFAKDI